MLAAALVAPLGHERMIRQPYWDSTAPAPRQIWMAPAFPGDVPTRIVENTPSAPGTRTLGMHGGRPAAPLAPRMNPLAGALAPFFAPDVHGDSGISADSMYSMAMPLMATVNRHGRVPRAPDPNVLPAIQTMVKQALPDPDKTSDLDTAVAYGGVIAGMGGVHGLRGHSLKRIHGVPAASAQGVVEPADYPIRGDGSAFSGPPGVYPGPGVNLFPGAAGGGESGPPGET